MFWVRDITGNLVNLAACSQIAFVKSGQDEEAPGVVRACWPNSDRQVIIFAGSPRNCLSFLNRLHALLTSKDFGLMPAVINPPETKEKQD